MGINVRIQELKRLTIYQLSDMANNDLEKYAKALDRYVNAILHPRRKMLTRYQCYHEVSFPEDGGGKRHNATLVEQDIPGDR